MKKVSIIIPVYNGDKYIKECIDSILNQTYKEIEIIVVDDGSIDTTKQILKMYEKRKNIILSFQKNLGAPAARNNGFNLSTGEYILFFDADDYMKTEYIEHAVNVMEKGNDIVISNFQRIYENGVTKDICFNKRKGFSEYESLFFISPFPNNKLYKREIIEKNNIRFDDLRMAQDINFYYKYLQFTNKIGFNEHIDSFYRIHSNSISTNYSLKIFDIEKSLNLASKCLLKENEQVFICARLYHYNSQLKKFNYYNKEDQKEIIKFFKNVYNKNIKNKLSSNYKKFMKKHLYYICLMLYLPFFVKPLFNKLVLERIK